MQFPRLRPISRRRLLRLAAAVPFPISAMLAACSGGSKTPATPAEAVSPSTPSGQGTPAGTSAPAVAPTRAQGSPAVSASPTTVVTLVPTPACGDDDDDPTPSQTEGPYFTPGSPERASLIEPGTRGTRLVLTGVVLNTGCAPVARALIDFWQCDDAGIYDNSGFKLRGHQFTDAQGRYRLETIVPGVYPGRTRHIHLKIQAPNRPVLTTQLYFPNEPGNARDGIFNDALLIKMANAGAAREGAFDFVLES